MLTLGQRCSVRFGLGTQYNGVLTRRTVARRTVTTNTNPSDLDARKATILEAVVAEHIDTAQPVGSSSVAHSADLGVSPATVRSEMVALEHEGYLAQPHTSAGPRTHGQGLPLLCRPPQSGVMNTAQQHQVQDFFANVRGEVEDVLQQTPRCLVDSRTTPRSSWARATVTRRY